MVLSVRLLVASAFFVFAAMAGPRLGAADFEVNPYDPDAAFAEALAQHSAGLGTAAGNEAALGWGESILAGAATEAQVRAALRLRFAALTEQSPLPEGFRGEFIGLVALGAMEADVLLGVPASVSIAQAILESGWGRSAPGNNLFGMKGEGPAGSTVRKVVEYRNGKRLVRRSRFRAYHDVEGSLVDHARVLSSGSRYEAARSVADDPAAYGRALQGKYASDPRYAKKLDTLRSLYALDRFDWIAPTAAAVAGLN